MVSVTPDHDPSLDGVSLSPELARLLGEHSPRLSIDRPTLIRSHDSPTGWLLVEPFHLPAKKPRKR